MGLLAQQLVLGAYKVGLPGLGGFMSIPVVYGMTFAIGKVMDEYLIGKSKNNSISSYFFAKINLVIFKKKNKLSVK